jgi:cell division protein FtsA
MSTKIVVGLDIGTTKICTVIGEVTSTGGIDIIGVGSVPSEGLKRGVVVNIERTVRCIRDSVSLAERVAGVKVTEALVGVAGPHIRALTSHGMGAIRNRAQITSQDVERVVENARAVDLGQNIEVIHVLPQEYIVDGQEGIKDPKGMHGMRLEVDVHIVTGAQGPLANLKRCVQEAGLRPVSLALQAYASGLAVLADVEEDNTSVLVDIGGGTTDVGVFRRGYLAHSAVIPFGGDHVTSDLAQILKIPGEEAERIKKKHGAAMPELADQELTLELMQGGGHVHAHDLARIIKPRLVELFDFVRHEVDNTLGPIELIAGNVILTGGTAQMRGILELAREVFKLPVRIGKPQGVGGLDDMVASPAQATAVGLVLLAQQAGIGREVSNLERNSDSSGMGNTSGNTVGSNSGNVGTSHHVATFQDDEPLIPVVSRGSESKKDLTEAIDKIYDGDVHAHIDDLDDDPSERPRNLSLWERLRAMFKDFF